MNIIKKMFSPALALMLFLSCQYENGGSSKEERSSLLSLTSESGPADDTPVPRFSLTDRKLALPQQKKKWTVLVYMDGDNNLSRYSSKDIKEMMASGSDGAMNIVVLWDNDPSQDVQGTAERHGYYYVERGGVTLIRDTGEVNMGDPRTARDFIAHAVKNFPAEHYLWIWWNHGGAVDRMSAMKGVCWDDTNSGDHLTEIEQKDIMRYFKEKAGKKIDVVGFDACLMATAEIAYQYRDVASYLVASEQSEPGDGWDYAFLSRIKANPSLSARSVAIQALSYYKNYYVRQGEEDATMSVLYLAYAGPLGRSLGDFAAAARSGVTSAATYRALSKGLPMFGFYSDGDRNCYFTKDLYGYLKAVQGSSKVAAAVREKAGACMGFIAGGKLVVSEWHGSAWKDAASGTAITLKSATAVYRALDLCADTQWDEFLNWAKFPANDYAF
ncbi:MAG TPA: clostripain-related cysteine peptidase [Spirochaetota bacterium]|nr:clostripain-related cysteine peptidase [Spirochaetota bacterium]